MIEWTLKLPPSGSVMLYSTAWKQKPYTLQVTAVSKKQSVCLVILIYIHNKQWHFELGKTLALPAFPTRWCCWDDITCPYPILIGRVVGGQNYTLCVIPLFFWDLKKTLIKQLWVVKSSWREERKEWISKITLSFSGICVEIIHTHQLLAHQLPLESTHMALAGLPLPQISLRLHGKS